MQQATLRRLGEVCVVRHRAEGWLDHEPGLGDAWLAYLALAPDAVVVDLMGDGEAWIGGEG